MKKSIFYLLSFTWGILMTLVGLMIALVLLCCGKKPKKWGWCWCFEVGKNWGGFSVGPVIVVSQNASERTKNHEHGHSIQNCYWGILMPFVISIPSMVRYWYRELRYSRKGEIPPIEYDSIWFEGQATKLGTEYVQSIREVKTI